MADAAFAYATNLSQVIMPNTITKMFANVFLGCTSLYSVELSENLQEIGYQAFLYCSGLINFNIPPFITSIGFQAFGGCSNLTQMIIPDSVTLLGDNCFNGCNSIEIFDTGNGVTFINKAMMPSFRNTVMRELTIGNSVTNLGGEYDGFMDDTHLKKLTIGNSLATIHRSYFGRNDYLETLIIGNNSGGTGITTIGPLAFSSAGNSPVGLPALKTVYIGKSVGIIQWDVFNSCGNLTDVVIEDGGVTEIGYRTFSGCSSLTNINLPIGLKEVSYSLFSVCFSLENITIPNTVTLMAENVFYECGALKALDIPDSVVSIGGAMCFRCSSLGTLTLSNSITRIPYNAFYECTALTEVELPDGLLYMDDQCFSGCKGLRNSFTIPDSVISVNYGALSGLSGIRELIVGNSVTALPQYAIGGCLSLERVTIGNSVTFIGTDSFSFLPNLRYVKLGNSLQEINEDIFVRSYYIKELHIGDDTATVPVTNIGIRAFYFCQEIETVTFGRSVLTIGQDAFASPFLQNFTLPDTIVRIDSRCLGGNRITNVTVPNSVTYLGGQVFEYCSKLTATTIGNQVQALNDGLFLQCPELQSVVIGKGVTAMYASIFESATKLKTATIEEDSELKMIGQNSFYQCALENMTLPDGVTFLGPQVFAQCRSMKTLKIGSGAEYVGDWAFANLDLLETLEVGAGPAFENITYQQFGGCLSLKNITIKGNVASIGNVFPKSLLTNITLGNDSNSIPSTTIQDGWFNNCPILETLTLGNLVTNISDNAFAGCGAITELYIGQNVATIKKSMFANSSKIRTLNIGSNNAGLSSSASNLEKLSVSDPITPVTIIEAGAFENLTDLSEVVTGPSVVTIQANAFAGCTNLETFVVGDSVAEIDSTTFTNCSALTLITLGKAVSSINGNTFDTCIKLRTIEVDPENPYFTSISGVLFNKNVTSLLRYPINGDVSYNIPSSVTDIVEGAFENCVNLTRINIPSSVVSIGSNMFVTSGLTELILASPNVGNGWFQNCSALSSIVLENTVKNITANAFTECPLLETLAIPYSVTYLDNSAFQKTVITSISLASDTIGSGWFQNYTALTSVDLENTIKNIASDAFKGCLLLTTISIPNSVTFVDNTSFQDSGLTNLIINSTTIPTSWFQNYSSLKTLAVGNNVSTIESQAFLGCNLTEIAVGDLITNVNSNIFPNVNDLQTLTLGNSITYVEPNMFSNSSNFKTINVGNSNAVNPSIIIDDSWFQNYSSLTYVNLGDGVSSISANAFSGCSGLITIVIGNNITTITSSMFSSANGVESLTLGNAIANFDPTLFSTLSTFKNLTIGNSNAVTPTISIPSNWFQSYNYLQSLIIGDSVSAIANNAFSGCSSLINIDIGCNVVTIDSTMFPQRNNLTTLIVGNSNANKVTTIGADSFSNSPLLANLTIGSSVINVNSSMFSNCNALTTLVVNSNNIGDNTFENLTNLQTLTIGESVTNVANNMFNGCTALQSLDLNCRTISSSAFSGFTNLINLTIGDNVNTIGSSAFSNCSSLTQLIVGVSVASIDNTMFLGCLSLTDISIGWNNNATPVTILGAYSFANLPNLINAEIGNAVASIGDFLFENDVSLTYVRLGYKTSYNDNIFLGCDSLTTVDKEDPPVGSPSPIGTIEANAFKNNTKLETYTISEGIISIGSSAFENCNSLATVTIPSTMLRIGIFAFKNCTSFSNTITIPNATTLLADYVFNGCNKLPGITIGNNVPTISSNLLDGCTDLKNVTIGDSSATIALTDIQSDALKNLTSLTHVSLGQSVKSIGDNAMEGCTGLETITIPKTVTHLGKEVFLNATGLTAIIFESGSQLVSIGDGAFKGCIALKSIVLPDTVTSPGSNWFNGCSALTDVTIGSLVSSIDSTTFSGCSLLSTVVIGSDSISGAIQIGSNCFYNFTSLTSLSCGLDCIETVGDNMCYGCTALTYVRLNVRTTVGNNLFQNCSALTDIYFYTTNANFTSSMFSGANNIKNITLSGDSIGDNMFSGFSSLINLDISGIKYSIGKNAFYNCTNLTSSIQIGTTVTYIYENAFNNCSQIPSLTFLTPRTSSMGLIGDYAFQGMTSLTSLEIPHLTSTIDTDCFGVGVCNNCSNLNTITFKGWTYDASNPSNLSTWFTGCDSLNNLTVFLEDAGTGNLNNYIPDDCFKNMTQLKTVVLGGVNGSTSFTRSIGASAFEGCTGITSLTIEKEYGLIKSNAFKGCNQLSSLTLNGGFYIESGSFQNCSILNNISFSSDCQSIGDDAFNGCSNIKSTISIPAAVTFIGSRAFNGCSVCPGISINSTANCTIGDNAFYGGAEVLNLSLGSNVVSIGDSAFYGLAKIQDITIPNSTTFLGPNCFANCVAVLNLIIGDGISDIQTSFFANNLAIQTLTIGSGVQTIEIGAFAGRTELQTVYATGYQGPPASLANLSNSKLRVEVGSDKLLLKANMFTGSGTQATQPISLTAACDLDTNFATSGLPLSGLNLEDKSNVGYYTINDSTFENSSVINFVLTDKHWVIGNNAFKGSGNLSTFNTKQARQLGDGFLQNCVGLKTVTIGSSVTTPLKGNMLSGTTNLSLVTIGDFNDSTSASTVIEANGLASMPNLKQLFVGNNISTIGNGAFANNPLLETLVLGKNVASVNSTMFVNSPIKFFTIGRTIPTPTTLASLKLKKLKSAISGPVIEPSAFENNTTLLTVEIGADVASIGADAFSGCSNLGTVYFDSTSQLPTIGANAFAGIKTPNVAYLQPGVNVTNILGIFTTLSPNPTWPINVVASNVYDSATLTWDAPIVGPSVDYYTVTSSPALDGFPLQTTSTLVNFEIPCDIIYTFNITATSSAGESLPSPSNPILNEPPVPDVVTGVTASIDYLQITVSWDAPTSSIPIDYYTITSNPEGIVHTTTSGNVTSDTFYSPTYGSSYTFTVTATNCTGTSEPSDPSNPVQPQYPCFKEGSKILTNDGYKPIETLRNGDLIQTLKHGLKPIVMIGKRDIYHPASDERIKEQLYKCSPSKYREVWEDLVLTGCHSILVDNFYSKEQEMKSVEINGGLLCVTDDKYRLPSCADERASVYETPGEYTIYHLALENDDYFMNYGIYANGLLVETCSKRYMKELSQMTLIE